MNIKIKVEINPTNHVIIQNIKNTVVSSKLNKIMHVHCECMNYLCLPCSNSALMASCMNIGMDGMASKQEL